MLEVDPAPQPHRFHPEPSCAPQDEACMRPKMSSWRRPSITMNSVSQCVQMCPQTYSICTSCKHNFTWTSAKSADEPSTNQHITILKHSKAFALPRCDLIHLISLSPGDARGRVKDALCHWPVTNRPWLSEKYPCSRTNYLRRSLSQTAVTHQAILGLDYGQN